MKPISNYIEREKIMYKRKRKKTDCKDLAEDKKISVCSMCGREMKVDECIWQVDDEGMVCADCLAERESCGCSD